MLPKFLLTLPQLFLVFFDMFLYRLSFGDCLRIFWVQAGDVYLNTPPFIDRYVALCCHIYIDTEYIHSEDIPPSHGFLQNQTTQNQKRPRRKILWQIKAAEMDHMQTRSSLRPLMPSLPRGLCIHSQQYKLDQLWQIHVPHTSKKCCILYPFIFSLLLEVWTAVSVAQFIVLGIAFALLFTLLFLCGFTFGFPGASL